MWRRRRYDPELFAFLTRLHQVLGGDVVPIARVVQAWPYRDPGDVWCITPQHSGWLQPDAAANLIRHEPVAVLVPA